MKPQKKATVAQKAPKSPSVASTRRPLNDKSSIETKKDGKKLKKMDKIDEPKKKLEFDKKRLERKKLIEEEKKMDDSKRKEKSEKLDSKKSSQLLKDMEKKSESGEDKKIEKTLENAQEPGLNFDTTLLSDKRKNPKSEEKQKVEKQHLENKKKTDRTEEKKRTAKGEINESEPTLNSSLPDESKLDEKVQISATKKKIKEEKRKDVKVIKPESKDMKTNSSTKEKKLEKKSSDVIKKAKATVQRKTPKPSLKKPSTKKTVVAKKSPLAKKLIEKKMKLVKTPSMKEENSSPSGDRSEIANPKKKTLLEKSKITCVKKVKLAKQLKAKLAPKNEKIKNVIKKDKLRKITEKVGKKGLDVKDLEKLPESKKLVKDVVTSSEGLKQEVAEKHDEEDNSKSPEVNKSAKLPVKPKSKRAPRKSVKTSIKSVDGDDELSPKSENLSPKHENIPKSPASNPKNSAENNALDIDLKIEVTGNTSSSDSPPSSSDSDHDYVDSSQRRKIKNKRKDDEESLENSSNDERTRRMRLFGFWSGPKRHRVASLNALAKVHCLYENEAGGVYLGGFCKPKPEKDTKSKKTPTKEEKEEFSARKEKDKKPDGSNNTSKRNLRNVPGLRGKHWDMMECSSSSSSSSEDESGQKNERNVKRGRKKNIPRKKKSEEVMDLKDMVVCKRMASLNASAILAASYSDEKNRQSSSEDTESESSEVEIIKKRKQVDNEGDKKKNRLVNDDDVLKPGKKVVVLNQDTDVTITGVYVNQTRSTHHEGFCSIAGMQYRISSTSHTQTAATAVATELHEQKVEQPCKSYTPLGALSSMQPPGSQGNHADMSPRRHSAFSAPHQHGYYQPAGPLIQHPPTLPPVKAPPPEPTPTPPQNSEGSDDLIATSTTSGGTTTAAGGFYRAYCPQYYGTPPQYQELCYPPTYPHPHSHPPPYYKYAPAYRRQYFGYPDTGGAAGGGGGGGGSGASAVEYQPPPPPPPGDYPMPPYYSAYPPPPPPPPPPPNPAYLHAQGRPIVDHPTFQGCPCPMQSCPKNVDTGPLIGNGKGAPVASGPGLSLPPSALVGPPSPARGLAGLAPPHGANAWDTDRVQLNTHRNLNQNQSNSISKIQHHDECNNKEDEEDKSDDKEDKNYQRCLCQKRVCTSTCEVVKKEKLSPSEGVTLQTTNLSENLHGFKLENNNVKCESCSVGVNKNLSCTAKCNVECENDYKCDIIKCEQCIKEGQIAILEIDKDSGILLIDDKLDENCVKEEIADGVGVENDNWGKPDYEATVVNESVGDEERKIITQESKCQKLTKRKLSLDSLSDSWKNKKVDKRTLSVGSTRDNQEEKLLNPMSGRYDDVKVTVKKKNNQVKRKAEEINPSETSSKKIKGKQNGTLNCLNKAASESSIMETIDNVIQQSLQMTNKKDLRVKSKETGGTVKRKTVNILSMIKKVPKAIVKAVVNDEISLKTEIKSTKDVKNNKIESKIVKIKNSENKSKIGKINNKIHQLSKGNECKKVDEACEDIKKTVTALPKKKKNNNKSTKKAGSCKKSGKTEENIVASENSILVRRPFLKPKWSNGWSWDGESYEAKVYLTNEESAIRRCYAAMKHVSGDVLRPRDCVLLKSGPRKADLPYVAKIAALWENPDDGEMMFSLLWYYRPEHTEQGRTDYDTEDEVFASRHRDANSVACIEDKCYILTFNEYCRYRKDLRRMEEGLESPGLIVPPGDHRYPRKSRQPPIPVPSDMVLFCRRVYDYRGKKLVKNPG